MYKPYAPVFLPARHWDDLPAAEAADRPTASRLVKAKPGRNRTLGKRGSRP
jgi:hypothetical protein